MSDEKTGWDGGKVSIHHDKDGCQVGTSNTRTTKDSDPFISTSHLTWSDLKEGWVRFNREIVKKK